MGCRVQQAFSGGCTHEPNNWFVQGLNPHRKLQSMAQDRRILKSQVRLIQEETGLAKHLRKALLKEQAGLQKQASAVPIWDPQTCNYAYY